MDWFEQLTGFKENGYEQTRRNLEIEGPYLRSRVNGRRYRIGELELVSLQDLRRRAASHGPRGSLGLRTVVGDVRRLHREEEYAGALFQVASQFNLLEMVGPEITPEQGVARYALDPTQGPACAIAAGAATIYRNYFVPIGDERGQTAQRQLDALADVGEKLSRETGQPIDRLWRMRNGYADCTPQGLEAIAAWLESAGPDGRDELRSLLRIGLHRDVQVTEADGEDQLVSQAFCSALPVAYFNRPPRKWQPFAELVLEAAYEATLLATALNAGRRASNIVMLTRLGGGAFGNEDRWIDGALERALTIAEGLALDVRMVRRG